MRLALLLLVLAASLCPAGEIVKGQLREFRLTDRELDDIDAFARNMVAPDVAAQFDAAFGQWRHDARIDASLTDEVLEHWDLDDNSVKPPLSSDSFAYVKTKAYRDLRKLGPAVIPLLVAKMACAEDPYNIYRLYGELQKNPRLLDTGSSYLDRVSIARLLAKLWLDEQTRQQNSLTPADQKLLDEIRAQTPAPVVKEFDWRFRDWRVRRADEIRNGVPPGESTAGAEILDMGSEIVPLLLREIAAAPGGHHALGLYEKLNPALPPREENEHPQAYAARLVKRRLVNEGYADNKTPVPPADFFNYPISPDDLREIDRLADAATPDARKRFEQAYAAWLLARSPDRREYGKWEEILTGGPEVDALADLGEPAIPLLVREMANDPTADFVMPLYRALQKDPSLLPHIPEPYKADALARRAAKMWLDVNRPPAADAARHQLGSPDGPQPHLAPEQAKQLLDAVRDIPDADKEEFNREYAKWREYSWDLIPTSSNKRKRHEMALSAKKIKNIGRHALPLLMERIAFDPDHRHAETLLYIVSPNDAIQFQSQNPWLPGNLAIVKNWLAKQN